MTLSIAAPASFSSEINRVPSFFDRGVLNFSRGATLRVVARPRHAVDEAESQRRTMSLQTTSKTLDAGPHFCRFQRPWRAWSLK